MDKGSAALANTLELEKAGVGWISALPWNQAPAEFRERDAEQSPPLSNAQPGVRAAAAPTLVHSKQYRSVVKYSASFAGEQLHSLTTSLSKVLQKLRRLSGELSKPKARYAEPGIRGRIARWLAPDFLRELVRPAGCGGLRWPAAGGAGLTRVKGRRLAGRACDRASQ